MDAGRAVGTLQMIFQKQTRTGPNGNCFHTCIACLLDMPVEKLPSHLPTKGWFRRLNSWLARRGLNLLMFPETHRRFHQRFAWCPSGYYIACGPTERTKRGGYGHAVVYCRGRLAWDPHPEGNGLKDIEGYAVLVAAKPHRLLRRKSHGNGS